MSSRPTRRTFDREALLARARLVDGLTRRGVPTSDALVALGLTARLFGAVAMQLKSEEHLSDDHFLTLLNAENPALHDLVAEHRGEAAALRAAVRSSVRRTAGGAGRPTRRK